MTGDMLMKKRMAVLLLLAAAMLLLTACGGNNGEQAADSAAPAATEAAVPAETATLAERVEAAIPDAASLAPFTGDDLADMAGIEPADYTDFVFLQGNGMDGREILVLRAADEQAADRLAGLMESYLERRMEEMENYAPKAYQIYSAAKVERKGLLLVLISGENAEAETAQLLAGE